MSRENKKYVQVDPDSLGDILINPRGTYRYRCGVDPLNDPERELMCDRNWVLERQFYSNESGKLSCRCIRGNCRHKNHLCKPIRFERIIEDKTIQFNYARGALLRDCF